MQYSQFNQEKAWHGLCSYFMNLKIEQWIQKKLKEKFRNY